MGPSSQLNVSLRNIKVGRVRVERTYEHLIRVSDATGLPYAPLCHSTLYIGSCQPQPLAEEVGFEPTDPG